MGAKNKVWIVRHGTGEYEIYLYKPSLEWVSNWLMEDKEWRGVRWGFGLFGGYEFKKKFGIRHIRKGSCKKYELRIDLKKI